MTLIGSGQSTDSNSRQIVRSSSGNIIAVVQENATTIRPYVSSDDGDTWSSGTSTFNGDGAETFDIAIGSGDGIHITARDPNNVNDVIYHQFTITSTGSVTVNAEGELVYNDNRGTGQCKVTVDSTDTVYATTQYADKIMGTEYDNLQLMRRDGAGSWTNLGVFIGNSSNNYDNPTVAADGVDDIHIVYEDTSGGNTLWNMWDSSAGSFVGEESVTASNFGGSSISHANDDEPVVTVGNSIFKRDAGTWTSETFTTESVDNSTVTYNGTDIFVLYQTSGNIHWNYGQIGSFDSSAYSVLVDNANTLQEPSGRWQQNSANDPYPYLAEILYYDSTNGEIHYDYVQTHFVDSGSLTSTSALSFTSDYTYTGQDQGGLTTATAEPITAPITTSPFGIWTSESNWNNAQSTTNIAVDGGSIQLATAGIGPVLYDWGVGESDWASEVSSTGYTDVAKNPDNLYAEAIAQSGSGEWARWSTTEVALTSEYEALLLQWENAGSLDTDNTWYARAKSPGSLNPDAELSRQGPSSGREYDMLSLGSISDDLIVEIEAKPRVGSGQTSTVYTFLAELVTYLYSEGNGQRLWSTNSGSDSSVAWQSDYIYIEAGLGSAASISTNDTYDFSSARDVVLDYTADVNRVAGDEFQFYLIDGQGNVVFNESIPNSGTDGRGTYTISVPELSSGLTVQIEINSDSQEQGTASIYEVDMP